ncbi:MAG: endonuclease NucS [Candidatus Bathyarchaeota archaeon]|nr:endonuclease NucS [Candidatus Bathyarchaeota archaeon]
MAIKRIALKDQVELQKVVAGDISVVEDGLTAVCDNMPIDSKTNIDILCHDDEGQLVVVKLSTKEDDNMFFESLKIRSYVNSVKPMLKFSYKSFKISEAKTPRLVLLAPSFSPQLVDVVAQMQGVHMDLYTWEYFEFDDKKALHLEPAWIHEKTKSKPKRPKPQSPKPPKTVKEEPKEEPEKVTEEVVMPVEDALLETAKKEPAKKKSIFSI